MFISKSEFRKRLWQAEHNGYLKGLEVSERCQELGDVLYQLSQPIITVPDVFKEAFDDNREGV